MVRRDRGREGRGETGGGVGRLKGVRENGEREVEDREASRS